MADLAERARSRGQILLVTALILGVSFVALALILNSAIFTENLASRGDTTGADEVVTYQNNLQDGIEKVVDYETRNATHDDTEDVVYGRILTGIRDADNITVRRHAKRGATSNVSIADSSNGTRIYQANRSRNFTDAEANDDWTVASGVETRAFRFNVTDYVGSNEFVVIIDGSHTWELIVRENSGDAEVVVDNGTSGTQSCGSAAFPRQIDLTAGTVDGAPCEALNFDDVPDDPYEISFENGSEFTGNYSLVVDDGSLDVSSPRFSDPDNPTLAPAVYDLTVEYYYRTSDILVGKEFGIAPGDPDGR